MPPDRLWIAEDIAGGESKQAHARAKELVLPLEILLKRSAMTQAVVLDAEPDVFVIQIDAAIPDGHLDLRSGESAEYQQQA